MNCPQCGGQPVFLGGLGQLDWFRCRSCGWEFSDQAPPLDEADEDMRSWDQLGEDVTS